MLNIILLDLWVGLWINLPSSRFHTSISPVRLGSPPPLASCLPSGLKSREVTRFTMGDAASSPPIILSNSHLLETSQTAEVSPLATKSPSRTYHFSILPGICDCIVCGRWSGLKVVTWPLPEIFCVLVFYSCYVKIHCDSQFIWHNLKNRDKITII